jgi:hypothetical protein
MLALAPLSFSLPPSSSISRSPLPPPPSLFLDLSLPLSPPSLPFPLPRSPAPGVAGTCGLGIKFREDEAGRLHVIQLAEGGAGKACGALQVGDVLSKLDGVAMQVAPANSARCCVLCPTAWQVGSQGPSCPHPGGGGLWMTAVASRLAMSRSLLAAFCVPWSQARCCSLTVFCVSRVSPRSRSSLRAGQRASPETLAARCRGPEGSRCVASFYRPPSKTPFEVTLVRSNTQDHHPNP